MRKNNLVKIDILDIDKSIEKSIVDDLNEITESNDLEYIDAFAVDIDKDLNQFDFLYQVYYKVFNEDFDISVFERRLEKLNDSEVNYYQATQIKDIVIVYLYL